MESKKKKRAADCVLSDYRVSLIRNKNNICFVLGCRTKSSKLVSTRKNAQSSKRYVVVTVKPDVLLMGTLQCCGAMFQY